jgi:hypothetical protein
MAFNLAWGVGSWVSGIWQTQGQFALLFVASASLSLVTAGVLHVLFGGLTPAESTPPRLGRPIITPAE